MTAARNPIRSACLLLLLCGTALFADDGRRYLVEASGDWLLGHTTYDLSAAYSGGTVFSRLAFPLDSLQAGLRFQAENLQAGRREGSLAASVRASLNDPTARMIDEDWDQPTGYPKFAFSYTESGIDLSAWTFSLSAEKRLVSWPGADLLAAAGYTYQFLHEVALDFEGWYYEWNAGAGAYDLYMQSYAGAALDYKVYYHTPSIGLRLVSYLHPLATVTLSSDLLLVYGADRDDHLLRTKLSTASGLGFGLALEGAGRLFLDRPGSGPYLTLQAGLRWLRVSTDQRQYWYGSADPSAAGGTVYEGIGHLMTSFQYGLSLSSGFAF